MIRLSPGDLIAIKHKGKFYYYLIRTKIKFFGGNMAFIFHRTSKQILTSDDLMSEISGFHTFVDFIEAKKDNSIIKLGSKVEFPKELPSIVKMTPSLPGNKADKWYFFTLDDEPVGETEKLSDTEKLYPTEEMVPVSLTFKMVHDKYQEGQDDRI